MNAAVPALLIAAGAFAAIGVLTGYRAAGVGGALLTAALFVVFAVAGLALMFRMALLARRAWIGMLLLGLLFAAAFLSWNVRV